MKVSLEEDGDEEHSQIKLTFNLTCSEKNKTTFMKRLTNASEAREVYKDPAKWRLPLPIPIGISKRESLEEMTV